MLHLTRFTHFFLTIFLIGLSLSCKKTTDSGTKGDGSDKANPIVIYDYAGLKAMATHGLDKHYALGAHINAKGSWAEGETNCTAYDGSTVPSTGTPCNGWGLGNLTGSLDGGGFQIRKLYRRKEAGNKKLGLFDSLASGAILKNVHLSSVRIHAEGELFNQGGLVGEAAGRIEHCSVSGVLSNNHPSGIAQSKLGGLVGHLNAGVIESSKVFNFEILENNDPGESGGLVGLLSGGSISSSYVEDSKIHAHQHGGGLVGESSGTSTIKDSYTLNTTVKGTASSSQAGGILGNASESTLIINSFVKNVEVLGGTEAGGIVGQGVAKIYSSYVDSTSRVSGATAGGLVGYSKTGGNIFYSYSHAAVEGSSSIGSVAGKILQTKINGSYGVGSVSAISGNRPNIGGLVGSSQSSHIYNSFWDTVTTSQASSVNGGPGGDPAAYTGPGTGLGTENIKVGCEEGVTSGICALGSAFVYKQGSYPKLKKCIGNCSDSNLSNHVYGADLLDGQKGCTASPNPTEENGHGSEKANPIVICDYAGLKAMATHGLDKHYALGTHINAKGSWAEGAANCTAYGGTTVPSTGTPCNGWGLGNLTGSLDGGGFQIRKLYRRKEAGNNKLGLFDSLASGAILTNVHLSSVRIHAEGELFNQGGLVGEAAGRIEYCSVSGVLSNNYSSSATESKLGGLVGHLNAGEIEFSKVFNFEILEGDDHYRSGGLVGLLSGGSISSSYVEDSKIHAYIAGGGLVGESSGTSTIKDSYTLNTTVKGTASSSQAGGILGNASESTLIINSFVKNVGVSGSTSAGGIVGQGVAKIYSSYVDSTSRVSGATAGGLVGYSKTGGNIFHSYSHAPVQGSSSIGSVAGIILQTKINGSYGVGSLSAISGSSPSIGGLVGSSQSSHIYDSFWDTVTTSQASSADGGNQYASEKYTGPGTGLGTEDIKVGCVGGSLAESVL